MAGNNREIAGRVKELRELNGLTAEEVAVLLKMPVQAYKDYEAGVGDISASGLSELCHALNVDLALLLTGEAPKMNVFTVTRRDKGVFVSRDNDYSYEALAANFANKKIEPFMVTIPADVTDASKALHAHVGHEMDFVLEGDLKVRIHNNEIILHPGDTIYFSATHPHGMACGGTAPVKFLAVIM